jgi:hypothetical protein
MLLLHCDAETDATDAGPEIYLILLIKVHNFKKVIFQFT